MHTSEAFPLHALIAFDALFYCDDTDFASEAEEYDYDIDELEARQLLELVRKASEKLQEKGYSAKEIDSYCSKKEELEQIVITDDYRILLPDRDNTEIIMTPLVKTVFILFLRHPEGISFKAMPDYEQELYNIYLHVGRRSDIDAIRQSVNRLVDPFDNALNISRSRISRSLSNYFQGSKLGQYIISGRQGEKKRIALDRSYVTWE